MENTINGHTERWKIIDEHSRLRSFHSMEKAWYVVRLDVLEPIDRTIKPNDCTLEAIIFRKFIWIQREISSYIHLICAWSVCDARVVRCLEHIKREKEKKNTSKIFCEWKCQMFQSINIINVHVISAGRNTIFIVNNWILFSESHMPNALCVCTIHFILQGRKARALFRNFTPARETQKWNLLLSTHSLKARAAKEWMW